MSDRIRVVRMVRTCTAMPAQWDGMTEDGRKVYVRWRFGEGYVGVAESPTAEPPIWGPVVATFDKGPDTHPFDGDLSYEELKALVPQIDWPESEIA